MTTLADLAGALVTVTRVLAENEPKQQGAWRRETPSSHTGHAVAHLETWPVHRQHKDLAHAATRALMALELALRPTGKPGDGEAAP